MSHLTRRPNSGKAKSKEFGKLHNEKAWREKRVTRKSVRDRKRTELQRTRQPSLKSKFSRRHWKNNAVTEWVQWENEGDDFTKYMSEEDDGMSTDDSDDSSDELEMGKAIKVKHRQESAKKFVNLIRDVLGGEFHAQEFESERIDELESEPEDELERRRTYKTVAEFRIVVPDATPRTPHEVWISLTPNGPQRSRSIRLFRSGQTLLNFFDSVLNEIVQDCFEIFFPSSLVKIVSSFCNASVLKFACLAECCLTIGDSDCPWYPGQRECDHVCDCCCGCRYFMCHCYDGDHNISMTMSHVDCDDEYWQLRAMSREWQEMGVHAFGRNFLNRSFDAYNRQRSRHVKTIMRLAREAAVSWDAPALGMVVLPYEKEPRQMPPPFWRR